MTSVVLGGVTLDLDPTEYQIVGGRRRGSVHQLIQDDGNGKTVVQDRGFDKTDLRIAMKGVTADVAVLTAIYSLYRQTGQTFTLTDFKSNSFTVAFTPGMESFNFEPIRGSGIGYTYQIHLVVTAVTTWFGSSYPS